MNPTQPLGVSLNNLRQSFSFFFRETRIGIGRTDIQYPERLSGSRLRCANRLEFRRRAVRIIKVCTGPYTYTVARCRGVRRALDDTMIVESKTPITVDGLNSEHSFRFV